MSTNPANLDKENSEAIYVALTIIMLVLSALGLYLYFHLPAPTPELLSLPTPTPVEELTPTSVAPGSDSSPTTIPSVTPTPMIQTLTSDTDMFTVDYKSSRTLYQDKEGKGNRYTLYSSLGNITIHVGPSWSWIYPNRQFTSDLLVSGQPTFNYEISTQSIIDFQFGDLNYTVQCIHNGRQSLKDECQQLLKDFRLIPSGS